MALLHDMQLKRRGIQSIQRLTRAMELVATRKLLRAKNRMEASRPYARKALEVIEHLATADTADPHPAREVREIRRAGWIVITSDRGLCGPLNIRVLKTVGTAIDQQTARGIEHDLCLIGVEADRFFRHRKEHIVAKTSHLGEQSGGESLIGVVKVMIDAFQAKTIDALYLCSSEFSTVIASQPRIQQILPLPAPKEASHPHRWDYLYEPGAKELLDRLLKRYFESQIYARVVEHNACEHASRMVAMKQATDNAGHMIDQLQWSYQRARQAVITQETAERAAGAE